MGNMTGRRPVEALTTVTRGDMLLDSLNQQEKIDRANPELNYGLGLARVVDIDYEEFMVTLQVLMGAAGTTPRVPVPMTFPGGGARHFLGSMPNVGDYCVVGWMPQESANPTNKTPVILAWVIPGVWMGKEWLVGSNFTADEADLGTKRERDVLEGVLPRTRHKLHHLQPGNVVASSSQGSDIVLDEGVTLANRRGNEFRLRDQDQAAVLRALQYFQALAGARIYSGMVQRDAGFLATQMFSDGKEWDSDQQMSEGHPLHEGSLPPSSVPEGVLTPARVLARQAGQDGLGSAALKLDGNVDPYMFLQRGGFIDSSGMVVDGSVHPDAVYGGKPIFRVAAQSLTNAALESDTPTLTEYRIELTHTSDGRLPVTEQTDQFDAERLPSSDPETPGGSKNTPFLEWVLGSVVGNDPFSSSGRGSYGLPLVARVFDGSTPNPRLDAATLGEVGGAQSTPIGEHAATLFRLLPVDGGRTTFWSVNKKGQLKASIGGPPAESSVEAFLQGGLKLGIGGRFDLLLNGEINLGTLSRHSFHLRAEQGPVTIYGGGSLEDAEGVGQRNTGTGKRGGDLPSVAVEGKTNVRIKAGRKVLVKGAVVEVNATSAKIFAHQEMELATGGRIGLSAEKLDITVTGKKTENFCGPPNFLPTAGALHEKVYTPVYPGLDCEKTLYTWGNKKETLLLGQHSTTVMIGQESHEVNLGSLDLRGMTAQVNLNALGITGTAAVGNVALTAPAGAGSFIASTSVLIASLVGPTVVRSSTSVYLGAPILGPDAGPIICAGSLEPLTGLPYFTWGMGAKAHIVGV